MKFSKRNPLLLLALVITALSAFGCESKHSAETKPTNSSTATQQTAAATQQNPVSPPSPPAAQNALTTTTTSKEPEMEISLPVNATLANVGSAITIPVTVSSKSNKEIFSYSFAVMFDPNVLQPTEQPISVPGTLSDGITVVADTQTKGRLGVAAASGGKTIKPNGTLLNTHFKVVGKATGKMNLKIAQAVFEDNNGTALNITATTKQ